MKVTHLDTQLELPVEVLRAHQLFVATGRDGSITIHYGKGQPRKIEWKEYEVIESMSA